VADNTTIDPGTGGDTLRDKDRAGIKTPIVGLDLNPSGSEVLGTGDATNGLDVDVTRVQGTVTVDSELTTADLDSGAGTDTRAVVGLVIAKSGGAANISNTDPVPVSDAGGTLSVDDGGGSITVDAAAASFANNQAQVAGTAVSTNSGRRTPAPSASFSRPIRPSSPSRTTPGR
jgi:hypothetical protein